MHLSIIIPTKDRGVVFDETLQSAMKSVEHIDAEIVVVNDSRETTPTIPNSSRIRLIKNPGMGVASARNAGVKSTSGDLILFLDDDIIISKASIDHILDLHREMDNVCFNVDWEYPPSMMDQIDKTQFGRFLTHNRMTSFKGWYGHPSWKDNGIFTPLSVASFHLSIKRKDFAKTPGYNENFPFAGFEDYDFPRELTKAGLSGYVDTRTKVYHNEADRLNFNNWLASWERRAATRKVGVNLGYKELALPYPGAKRLILSLIGAGEGVIRGVMFLIPNIRLFDPLWFKLAGALQAHRIYRGYKSR